jgi:hypothetical protein
VKDANIAEAYRIEGHGARGGAPQRIGIEKRGNAFSLFVSLEGEPLHQVGPSTTLDLDRPFYVGIGFCSHLPDRSDSATLSRVVLEDSAGKLR